ncbi:MAG: hypothetical protein OEZ47_01765 [Gammaproteobacteria bacterium]|nr:hypothetical protein [Gammaproteobacteria bacterium]
MLQVLKSKIENYRKKRGEINILNAVKSGALNARDETRKKIRVIIGPSFSVFRPSFLHDSLLASALTIRNAEIIPLYCDGIQSVECNYFGGIWTGNRNFTENCKSCVKSSESLWASYPNKTALSKYLLKEDYFAVDFQIDSLEDGLWLNYQVDGLPIGAWAKDILVNNYGVGDYHKIKGHEFLGRRHVKNLLLLKKAYEGALDDLAPDRIVSNDSYYGMWALLEKLAKKRNIPFYSQWCGGRQKGWCYAYNDAAMNLNFSSAWSAFSKIELYPKKREMVHQWLLSRGMPNNDMMLNTAALGDHSLEEEALSKIDKTKPTVLLLANVIWDLAALNKEIFFEDMMSWIKETVKWFNDRPEYQLIIKAHPAELHPIVPATQETVGDMLKNSGLDLNENVIFLSPKVRATVYEFFSSTTVGLVHTSTVGLELAAFGKYVITSGKSHYRGCGFTIDPATREEYFAFLEKALLGDVRMDLGMMSELAYKFIYFYQFHYYSKINIMDFKYGEEPILRVKSIDDILPNKNIHFDYFVESIADGLPIVSESRWPKES